MNVEERLVDALSELEQVDPSPDLFARVEASYELDREHRRRMTRFTAAGLAIVASVATLLVSASDFESGTVPGWAVFVAQLVILTTAVVVLGRVIPRFGEVYVSDVFRLDPATGAHFLRLQDVAYHLVFTGYIVIFSWHREMAGAPDITEAVRFLLDRTAGLFLLMGVLHAATLMSLPVIGLIFNTIVREHSRARAGNAAPRETPQARQAARVGRMAVLIIAGLVVVQILVGIGLVAGLGISGS